MFLVFVFVLFWRCFSEILGEGAYLWGCNNFLQIGRDSPTGGCANENNMVQTAELFVNDHFFNERNFTFQWVCGANTNLIMANSNQEIFSYGSDAYFLLGSHYGKGDSSTGVLIANYSHDFINVWECGHFSIFFGRESDGIIKVMSRNIDGESGTGHGYRGTPTFVLKDINIISSARYVTYFANGTDIQSTGHNLHYQIGWEQPTIFVQKEFSPINSSTLRGEAGELTNIWAFNMITYLYYESTNNLYGFGVSGRLITHILEIVHVPAQINLYHPLGDIPHGAKLVTLTSIGTCSLLVMNVNSTNVVYSHATYAALHFLGRTVSNDDYLYPKKINYGDISESESIYLVGNYGGSGFHILTASGKLYGMGNNNYFLVEQNVGWTENTDSNGPVRLIPMENSISYIPQSSYGGFYIALMNSFKCFDYFPTHDNACNGHGVCTSSDTCACTHSYSGENCEIPYTCYTISTEDHENVCSSHGNCVNPDVCQCDENHYGDECEHPYCVGLKASNKIVCNKRGRCKAANDCECTISKWYGIECNENIAWASFSDVTHTVIQIHYVTYMFYLPNPFKEEFECSMIINNYEILGNDAHCYFKFDAGQTKYLMIELNYNYTIAPDDFIEVITVSKSAEMVKLQVHAFNLFFHIMATYYTFFSIGFGVLFIVMFFVLIIIACCCVTYFQKRKITKFAELKDFDILLQEQKIQEDSKKANVKVNKNLFEIDFKDVKIKSIIGRGGSGAIIYKAQWKGQNVAYKVFRVRDFSNQMVYEEFEKEVQIVSSVRHPHILRFFGSTIKPPRIGLVLELAEKGDLLSWINIQKDKEIEFPLHEKIHILSQISSAMDYLHDKNIIHRDLKAENVLITEANEAKLIDFGLSKIFDTDKSKKNMTRNVGTARYMSPEIVLGHRNYTNKVDVFSFGILQFVVLVEIADPYAMYNQKKLGSIEMKVATNPNFRPVVPRDIIKRYENDDIEWYVELMKKCWSNDASKRPSFKEINRSFSAKDESVKLVKKSNGNLNEVQKLKLQIKELKERLSKYENK